MEPDPGFTAASSSSVVSGSKPRLRFFGDYELQEEIARGGMGVVYKARQLSLDRTVAVKMILGGQLAGVSDVQRFRAEAEAAASLRHPNIVAIHEVGEHDGQHFFSMDYVEGRSLAEIGACRRSSDAKWFGQAATWIKILAEAIYYAHQQDTLHRDIKPSNILIDGNDVPHVTDFGLAKRVKRDSDLTLTGQVLGTPNFMPPEQASGKRGDVGPQSDIYSLGAVLYFLLTGKPPFAADTVHETLSLVTHTEPAAPRALNPAVPRDLQTICLKCLEKEPRQRYASARELAEDLQRFLNDETVLARPVTKVESLWRVCRRHRLVTSLGAAAILLPIAAAMLAGKWARSINPLPQSATMRPVAEMPTNTAEGVAGVIDGKAYVTSATDGNTGSYPRSLYVYDARENSWKRLADSPHRHSGAAGGVLAGKLMVAGGEDENGLSRILEAYDPVSATWRIRAPMPTAREGCAGVVLGDRFYVLGGYDGTHYLDTVESYDWETDSWTNEPSMLIAREGCGAGEVRGVIYVVGGSTNRLAQAAEMVESWKPGSKWAVLPDKPMLVPVFHAGVSVIGNVLYVAAGCRRSAVTDVAALMPNQKGGGWQPLKDIPEPRYSAPSVVLNGELYVLGGWNDLPGSARLPCPDVFVYNPAANQWRKSGKATE